MNRHSSVRWFKALVVLSVLGLALLRLGIWSPADSPRTQSESFPARPPIALADLGPALDAEFAPMLKDGLLKQSTGGGVAIGVIDHGRRRVFTYGAARANSIFEIGSVTKTITGLTLAQLAAEGKVRLDEPLRSLIAADLRPETAIAPIMRADHAARPCDSSLGTSQRSG